MEPGWCQHHKGTAFNTCHAGIHHRNYAQCPCFGKHTELCAQYVPVTQEQLDVFNKELAWEDEKFAIATPLLLAAIKPAVEQNKMMAFGQVKCPFCDKQIEWAYNTFGLFQFKGACQTKGCFTFTTD